MARWVIVMGDGNFYRGMTAIGPRYGAAADTAKAFATKRAALAEMGMHWIGFATARAVRLDVAAGGRR